MEGNEDKGQKRRSSDPTTPNIEKGISKKGRRISVALGGQCGGGGSAERRKGIHGKYRKCEHDRKKSQRKIQNFSMRISDPLNLMNISQKHGCNSPKVDSPQTGDRALQFNPGNIRPVDVTDPLKLNNLDDTVLAVKVNSHKRKRKRKRRRTYSENDKDIKVESMAQDGADTEASENEAHSPTKSRIVHVEVDKEVEKGGKEESIIMNEMQEHALSVSILPEQGTAKTDQASSEDIENAGKGRILNCEKDDEPAANVESKEKDSKTDENKDKTSKQYNIKFREKDKKFQYGNYNRYYGYRNPNMSEDDRIEYLKKEWFDGKDCLDIGCNVGHLTLYIGRHFNPRLMTGIDIDDSLIRSARRNIQHYVSLSNPQAPKQSDFPISFPICHGPLAAPIMPEADGKSFGFPYNISFKTENYVDFEWKTVTIEPKYDFIMCLSVTKWIQLNWGDEGVKKLFKRIYLSLHPGGKLLLEPQPWKSYKKKKNLTQTTRSNYENIKFKPDKYIQYLLSNEVGFATSEKLGIPKHKAQGFQRPIYLLTKGGY